MENKDDIRLLNSEKLEEFFINKNQKKYRVNQVLDWVWNKSISSFSQMSNISDDLFDEIVDLLRLKFTSIELILYLFSISKKDSP